MPGMDRTGPMGNGPMGRKMGRCGGGQAGQGRRRGFHFGNGMGGGVMPISLSQDDEKALLEQQKTRLENDLAAITSRLQGMEQPKESE